MSRYVIIGGELYHYGVPGMKWGVRKKYYNQDGSLNAAGQARQNYKDAKSAYRQTKKQNKVGMGIGMKGIEKAENALTKRNSAYADKVVAKANFKAAKAKNSIRAKKAELKVYAKEMYKTGLPGSAADRSGRSKALYNKIKAEKGKEYADRVAKKMQNKAVGALIGSAVVLAGSAAAEVYLSRR